ncbi:MAG: DEAD/DEAH box helicase, partial [Actinomycetota bacterium]|nr:DEAD/DEAH box helicase [Actinomycetota bacterium]
MTDIATKSFADFGVDEQLCSALATAGITTPFPIQELTLGMALAGADLIGQARTGTGKTLAFGIPLLQRVSPDDIRTQALVIVPTRELCLQVRDDLDQAGADKGVAVVAAYGGRAIEPQADAIAKGAPIVVGTPGRLLDLLRRGTLTLSTVTALVLDEADEMLDLGFLPDVEQLIQATADQRQTMLFSATMPSAVVALARRYMNKPTFLRADVEEVRIGPDTVQHFFSCHRMDKPAVLARILQTPGRDRCLVFSRTKRMADILAEELRQRGINAAPIHSDLRQDARERALARFRNGTIDVLVATEVAARGLDITDVSHVVNYDCPDDEKMYLHRIGRTGRAGAAGVAITLAVWNELARLEMIKKALGVQTETHEVFSTSPILDELFDLPARQRAGRPAVATEEAGDERPSSPRKAAARRDTPGRTRSRHTEPAATRPETATAATAAATTTEPVQAAPATEAVPSTAPDVAPTPRTRKRSVRRPEADAVMPPAAAATPVAREATDDTAAAKPATHRTRSRRRATRPSARQPAATEPDTSQGAPATA